MINFEKDIIAEKCNGLYKAFNNIIGTHSFFNKLLQEYSFLSQEMTKIIKSFEEISKNYSQVSNEKEMLMTELLDLSEMRSDLRNKKSKLVKDFKEQFSLMQKNVSISLGEKETYKQRYLELDKKYQDLVEEFKKFRQKVKEKYSLIRVNEEKFCKNCQKIYDESDNFNWSCRIHPSNFNGESYWCCGKSGKDALGCLVSRHMNKEETEDNDELKMSINTKNICNVL